MGSTSDPEQTGRETVLGHLVFDANQQALFAQLSGDHNPLHMNALAARRTLFGEPLVHGMHLVLRVLESYFFTQNITLAGTFTPHRIACRFRKPVFLNETVRIIADPTLKCATIPDRLIFRVCNQEETLCRLTVEANPQGQKWPAQHWQRQSDFPQEPTHHPVEALATISGVEDTGLDETLATVHFPACRQFLTAQTLGQLAALSRIVGMACPGFHIQSP